MNVYDLEIEITSDVGSAVNGMKKLTDSFSASEKTANKFKSALKQLETGIGQIGSKLKDLSSGLLDLGSFVGITALSLSFKKLAEEAELVERNLLRTQAMLEVTGNTAGYTSLELYNMARKYGYATLQSTDGMMKAIQALLSFKSVTGEVFEEAISLATDMSALFGGDVTSEVIRLGKALEDPINGITALRRIGVSFSETQKEMVSRLMETNDVLGAQKLILEVVRGQLGGIAQNEAKGLAGAIDTLGQRWQEFLLTLENTLDLNERLTVFITWLGDAVKTITNYIGVVPNSAANEFEELVNEMEVYLTRLKTSIGLYKYTIGSLLEYVPGGSWVNQKFYDSVQGQISEIEEIQKRVQKLAEEAPKLEPKLPQNYDQVLEDINEQYLSAEIAAAKFTQQLNLLHLALKEGIITQEEYTKYLNAMYASLDEAVNAIRYQFDPVLKITEEYQKQFKTLDDALKANRITIEEYDRLTSQLLQKKQEDIAKINENIISSLNQIKSEFDPIFKIRLEYVDEKETLKEALEKKLITFEEYANLLSKITAKEEQEISNYYKSIEKKTQETKDNLEEIFSNFNIIATDKISKSFENTTAQINKTTENAIETAKDLIRKFEGLRLTSYWDYSGYAIGYGHHGPEVKVGMRIDVEQAEKYLEQDIARIVDFIKSKVTVELSDSQLAALTSFVYNVGTGAFANSTMLKYINAGEISKAAEEFDKWVHVTVNGNKQVLEGLVNRRAIEKQYFLEQVDNLQKSTTQFQTYKQATLEAITDPIELFQKKSSEFKSLIEERTKLQQELANYYVNLVSGQLSESDIEKISDSMQRLNEIENKIKSNREELISINEELIKSGKEYSYQIDLDASTLESIAEKYGSSLVRLREYRLELAKLKEAFEEGWLTIDEYKKAVQELDWSFREAQGPISEFIVELEKSTSLERFSVNVLDSFTSNLAKSLEKGRLDFRDFVDDVKSYLAEIVAKKIVLSFLATIGLNVTGSAVTTGLTSGFSFSNLISGLTGNSIGTSLGLAMMGSSLFNWVPTSNIVNLMSTSNLVLGGTSIIGSILGSKLFEGKYVSIGSTIGSTAGSIIGSMIAGPIGALVGALTGGTGGGWLGSLFGGGKPKFGGYQTSFSGLGFEDNVKSLGGFGLYFGLSGKTDNIDASEYQETLDGLATVSKTLANFYGKELETLVKNSLWQQYGDYVNWGKDLNTASANIFNTIIQTAKNVESDVQGKAHILAAVVEATGGLTAYGNDVAYISNVIQGSIEIATYTVKLFNTEIGKLMGLGVDEQFNTMTEAAKALTWYVQNFWKEGETSASMIERFITNLSTLRSALTIVGRSIDELGFSAIELMYAAESLRDTIESAGMTIDEFNQKQSAFLNVAYSDIERAQMQANEALATIKAWNESIGNTGDNLIDTIAELRAYIESLDPYSQNFDDLYVSAINVSTAFISLDQALKILDGTLEDVTDTTLGSAETIEEFIKKITPQEILDTQAINEMVELFKSWGMTLPTTSDALYQLYISGQLSNEQLLTLANNYDKLTAAWSAIANKQQSLIDSLTETYNAKVSELQAASQARIDQINEEYEARVEQLRSESEAILDQLREDYEKQVDEYNKQLDEATEALQKFESVLSSVNDALESLREQTFTGIDESRQNAIAEAYAAIAQYQETGELPDNIDNIISRLSSVNPEDFATKEEWLAAIAENQTVLEELQKIASGRVSEAQQQIDLLNQLIEQAEEQYNAAVEAENARLNALLEAEAANRDALIAAENENLQTQLAALEQWYNDQINAIKNSTVEQLLAMEDTNNWLELINQAITQQDPTVNVNVDVNCNCPNEPSASAEIKVPGYASGGVHLGGLRIVGENGPELEFTGPSRIVANNNISEVMAEANANVVIYLDKIRAEMRSQNEKIEYLTKIHKRWDSEGLPPDRMDYLKEIAEG